METFVENRSGEKISVVVDKLPDAKGLAFVMHGLGGFKEQPHVQAMREAFAESGYTTVVFDATHSFGESDGDYADATTTNHLHDLEDVTAWSKTQPWFQEPFVLSGHSLGGIATALYAQTYPEIVKAIAPISTVVSGDLWAQAHADELEEWQKTGWRIQESRSKPGTQKRLKWSFVEDIRRYDLLKHADRLTMPVLLTVGELDKTTPLTHQEILYERLPGPKELHVIKGSGHTPRHATRPGSCKRT